MPKIMVVDDDEDFTRLYKASLSAMGFDTTTVNRSTAAVEMAYLIQPDIFVIDLMMPDLDGAQLCKSLRKIASFRQTPIIMITALTDPGSQQAAIHAGANEYLTKPFKIDELKERINQLLGLTG
jgi:DNA-binding response OmpR family regulator